MVKIDERISEKLRQLNVNLDYDPRKWCFIERVSGVGMRPEERWIIKDDGDDLILAFPLSTHADSYPAAERELTEFMAENYPEVFL